MKKAKKIMSTLLAIITVLLCAAPAFAAVSYPSLSSTAYCEFTAAKQINVYKDTGFKTRGTSSPASAYNAYISKNDVCYIYKITDSYAQVNYPTSSGRKTGYIKTSDLLGKSIALDKSIASTKVTTYKYSGGAETGYIASKDTVYTISGSSYYNVIYTAKSGNRAFKLAYSKSTPTPTPTPTSTGSSKIPTGVFLTQVGNSTCTLSSAAMMLRARMALSGKSYTNITESSIKATAWINGAGLRWSWTYKPNSSASISVDCKSISSISVKELKELLDKHPEGIVLYCARGTSSQHAVFLTDYVGNTFYCADPYGNYSLKRISLADSLLGKKFGSQDNILKKVDAYWYVSSYSIK